MQLTLIFLDESWNVIGLNNRDTVSILESLVVLVPAKRAYTREYWGVPTIQGSMNLLPSECA